MLSEDEIISSLPEYYDYEEYLSEGFQDFTDYKRFYYFNYEGLVSNLENNEYFEPVTEENIETVRGYFKNYQKWVELEDFAGIYEFSYTTDVEVGDYWYYKTREGDEIGNGVYGKYDNYDVYYLDLDGMVLHYIHNNI
jgi:hypothetical protein